MTARSGSKSIPDKNIAEVGGRPLLAYSVALGVAEFGRERTWLSTDSPRYAEIGEHYGAHVPFLRPAALAGDSTSDLAVFDHAVKMEEKMGLEPAALWIHLRPTTPLRQGAQIQRALATIQGDPESSSLRSVQAFNGTPQKLLFQDTNGYLRTLDGSLDIDKANQPRQQFPVAYKPNGVVDILRRDVILSGGFHGKRSICFVTSPAIDIDDPADLTSLRECASQLALFDQYYFRD